MCGEPERTATRGSGEGEIGAEALVRVINHPALRDLPFCLETPNELPGYAEEIRFLKEHRQ